MCPVDDHHVRSLDSPRAQCGNDALAHLAGAHHDELRRTEPPRQALGGKIDRQAGQRRGPAPDRRLGANPAPGLNRSFEQPREHRPRRPVGLRPFCGEAHLTEDFVLARHRRAQARGDFEQVTHHGVVEVDRQLLRQLLDRRPCRRGQVLLKVSHALVESLDYRVELCPEASRKDDDLEEVGPITQNCKRLRKIVLENRDALEHV